MHWSFAGESAYTLSIIACSDCECRLSRSIYGIMEIDITGLSTLPWPVWPTFAYFLSFAAALLIYAHYDKKEKSDPLVVQGQAIGASNGPSNL